MASSFSTVDDYLASFDAGIRPILQQVRESIHAGMPGSTEQIRYGMPAVMLDTRYGLHFAGWRKHVGLYPVPVLDADLEADVGAYRSAKDGVSFQYSAPVPYDLITRIAAAIAARR